MPKISVEWKTVPVSSAFRDYGHLYLVLREDDMAPQRTIRSC